MNAVPFASNDVPLGLGFGAEMTGEMDTMAAECQAMRSTRKVLRVRCRCVRLVTSCVVL